MTRLLMLRAGFTVLFGLFCLFARPPVSLAQEDCGSGVPHGLVIAGEGRVIPGQVSNRVRSAPGGNQVGSIQEGETFTILDGPVCQDGVSWWQVSSSSGVEGWTAEGVDGQAFLESTGSGGGGNRGGGGGSTGALVNTNPDCSGVSSTLELGMVVQLNVPYQQIEEFYGHPLIPDTLYAYPATLEAGANDFSLFDHVLDFFDEPPAFLIQDGPVCFNGAYLWKIGPIDFGTADVPVVWVYETANNQPQFVPVIPQPEAQNTFTPTRVTLSRNSALVVDSMSQLAFGMGGGGCQEYGECTGYGGWAPDWNSKTCIVGWVVTTIQYYTHECMDLYPLPLDANVEVTVRRPDGSVYSQTNQAAQPLVYMLTTNPDDFPFQENVQRIEMGGVQVDIAPVVGDPFGVWTVEARSGETVIRQSYDLQESEFMDVQCEDGAPVIVFNGFEPFSEQTLVLAEKDLSEPIPADSEELYGFNEVDRWTVEMNEAGALILSPDFALNSGILALDGPDGWEANTNVRSGTDLDAITPKACPGYFSPADAVNHPIPYNTYITGTFAEYDVISPWHWSVIALHPQAYYVFNGQQGERISIEVSGFEPNALISTEGLETLRPILRLESPDGAMITEAQEGISDFTLPQSGAYTLVLSYENSGTMDQSNTLSFIPEFTLRVSADAQTSTGQGGQQTDLSVGAQASGTLPDKSTWTFAGSAGQTIIINAESGDFDSQLRLLSGNGDLLAEDDDSGEGMSAQITFTLPVTGLYTIEISSWNDKTGAYTLQLTH